MAKVATYKLKALYYKAVGAPDATDGTSLTGMKASFEFTQEDPTVNDIEDEMSDNPLLTTKKLGKTTAKFTLSDIDWTTVADLAGGSYNATTKIYTPPTSAQTIYKKFMFQFENGLKDMVIYRGDVLAKYNGTDMKNQPLSLDVTITVTPDTESIPGSTLTWDANANNTTRYDVSW